jgi:DNA polymerase III subunit epsilon
MVFHRSRFTQLFNECDCVISHNVPFDKRMLTSIPQLKIMETKLWVCSMLDIYWPKYKGYPKWPSLQDICEAYVIPYLWAHQASRDCNFLKTCLEEAFGPNIRQTILKAILNLQSRIISKKNHTP